MTVRARLFTLVALSVIGLLAVVAFSWAGLARSNAASATLAEHVEAIQTHMEADMMHDALRADVLEALAAAGDNDEDSRREAKKDVREHAKILRDAVAKGRTLTLGAVVEDALRSVEQPLGAYATLATDTVDHANADPVAAKKQRDAFMEVFKVVEGQMERVSDAIEKASAAAAEEASAARTSAIRSMLVASGIIITLVVFVGTATLRGIVNGLSQTVNMLREIADGDGDLRRRLPVNSNDELGAVAKSFNKFVEKVQQIIVPTHAAATEVDTSTSQLRESASILSREAQSLAAAVEETGASFTQLGDTLKQTSNSAHEASLLAAGSSDVAKRGGALVARTTAAMTAIEVASRQIASISGTIDEIAFQTNLLALNAAVEAARAGEQGRGFAVVAVEVRSLAQRSAGASKQIRVLIDDCLTKTAAGSALVHESGSVLSDIVASSERVSTMIAEMARAATEQRSNVDECSRTLGQVDQIVQVNANQAEQLANTTASVAGHAREIRTLVERFDVADESPAATPVPAASVRRLPAKRRTARAA